MCFYGRKKRTVNFLFEQYLRLYLSEIGLHRSLVNQWSDKTSMERTKYGAC